MGNPRRPIYLPAEVCKIAKGQRRLKLDERQTAEMITLAAKKPSERHQVIEMSINQKAKLPSDPTVAAWQMHITPTLTKVCHLSYYVTTQGYECSGVWCYIK